MVEIGLKSSSRQIKLKALNDLLIRVSTSSGGNICDDPEWDECAMTEMCKDVIALMADLSETIQEKAIVFYEQIISARVCVDGSLPNLFNLLRNRLGSKMRFYINDCLAVLEKTLADPFAGVRTASCQCLITLVPHVPSEFFTLSDSILDVLIATYTHNQAKVRAIHTTAMGYVLHFGNGKRVSEVWRLLAQRVLDSHHSVRQSAYAVLHFWMTHLRDRYSYWNRLVPLLLSGLFDELSEVQTEARRLWREVGEQYAEENRDEIKDRYDDEVDVPNYPPEETRPVLGCRVLVQRIFFNVVPSVLNDLKDWQENVAKGENQVVVAEVWKCAKLLGHFIEPNVYCELLVRPMEEASHLVLLSGILQGITLENFRLISESILKGIYRLSRTEQLAQQFYCLECVRRAIRLFSLSVGDSGYAIFRILATIDGLAAGTHLKAEVSQITKELAERLNLTRPESLYPSFAAEFLTEITGGNETELWLNSSLELKILQCFLLKAGLAVFLEHFNILHTPLKTNLQVVANVQIRYDIYRLIIDIIQVQEDDSSSRLKQVDWNLVPDFFFATMTWKAGRSNAIARAACCCCLAVLLDREIIDMKTIGAIKKEVITRVIALSRDECQETQRAISRIARLTIRSTGATLKRFTRSS
ncbi:Dynein assembly factor 5, axonemal [Hypsibius exemplaris]|uniref:Dynein assembly factor 5, axonemal n=1 Tax=Hypsibius exemplaris TaxID=2072580 RepID=A0A9X6RLF4_HYPEX|nr:Dynein assembly factor 5, axonemal [Hypsibius exemplaris]